MQEGIKSHHSHVFLVLQGQRDHLDIEGPEVVEVQLAKKARQAHLVGRGICTFSEFFYYFLHSIALSFTTVTFIRAFKVLTVNLVRLGQKVTKDFQGQRDQQGKTVRDGSFLPYQTSCLCS